MRRRARQRAKWLFDFVESQVNSAAKPDSSPQDGPRTKAFPPRRWLPGQWLAEEELITPEQWELVAEVAEHYPRMLAWLAEGQVGVLWNVFGAWIAVLRLIPGVRWLLWYLIFRRVAYVAPWRLALYETILQQQRLNANKGPSPESTANVPRTGVQGLSAMEEQPVVFPTKAARELETRIAAMSSGCIGISGLRGAGKSTLIQDFCAHRYGTPRVPLPERPERFLPGLRVLVEAPLRFDAREFLIHQYTCLCRAVLADVRFNPTTLARQLLLPFTPGRIRFATVAGTLSAAVFFAGSAFLGYLAAHGTWPRPPENLTNWEIAGAVVLGIAGMVAIGWRTKRAAREIRQIVNLATDAEARLARLHYQRTDTRSAGGAVTMPMGMNLSLGTSHEYTQQLLSLPELIDDYRDFVQRVVGGLEQAEHERKRRAVGAQQRRARRLRRNRDWQSRAARWPWLAGLTGLTGLTGQAGPTGQTGTDGAAGSASGSPASPALTEPDLGTEVRLVIGIDQMDQIDDPAVASRFLEELSACFGTLNCIYLLAVSPGTMAAVDQRMVPLRTSSAGLFDEMIWAEPFLLGECETLLSSRVVGLPDVLVALCYVLSGGLPRELLRVARSVVRAVQDQAQGAGIAQAVDSVIKDEVRALKHRTLASAAASDFNGALGLIEKLTDETWPWDSASFPDGDLVINAVLESLSLYPRPRLLPVQRGSADEEERASEITAEVCNNFIAGIYFLLTVHGLFRRHESDVSEMTANVLPRSAPADGAEPAGDNTRPAAPDVLASLAHARIALGLSPDLAVGFVSGVRKALLDWRITDENLTAEIKLPFLYHLRPQNTPSAS